VEVEGRKSVGADGRTVQYERRWRAALNLCRGGRSASWLATEDTSLGLVVRIGFWGDLCQERKGGGKEFTVETGQALVC
jgi:hypothetical protein